MYFQNVIVIDYFSRIKKFVGLILIAAVTYGR